MASYDEIVAGLYEVLEPFAKGSSTLGEDSELTADLDSRIMGRVVTVLRSFV